ncbi:MAG: hypothetical protein ACXVYM_06705 [Gaiellaceae bacterium]
MARLRPGILAILVVLSALAMLLSAGPAGARSTEESPPAAPAPDPAAQAFVDAAKQYVATAGPRIDEAVGRENDAIGACQTLVDRAPGRVQPQLADLIANDLATVTWRAMVSPYAQLVTQLAGAAGDDPVLRAAADAAWKLKELQLPLLARRAPACPLVRQWRETRWARSFPTRHPKEFATALVTSDDQEQARASQQAIDAAGERLLELGASPGDAMLFSSAAGSSLV